MTKFKAKADGYLYKKGAILELIREEADGCSLYRLQNGTEAHAWDNSLVELKESYCISKEQTKFSKGDMVRITKRLYGHKFKIGEIVTVKKVGHLDYCVINTMESWYVKDAEIEKVPLDKQGYPLAIGG